MIKKTIIIFIIIIIVIAFGIGENQIRYIHINATESTEKALLTPENAVSIIKNKFPYGYPNIVYRYDHDSNHDGKEFYVVHVYTNETDHIATIGWYGVDKSSGKIYDEMQDEYLN